MAFTTTNDIDSDPRLKTPCNILVAGPTQIGKSYFVTQLIKNKEHLFNPVPDKVIWCYACWQPLYDELKKTGLVNEFLEGIEELWKYSENPAKVSRLIVIDDLQREAQVNEVAGMFERGGHHENISVIYITQNVYYKGRESRNLSLNSHYLFLFRNKRDMSQINILARQIRPGNSKFIEEAYEDACSRPHGYLMMDFHPKSSSELQFRTDFLQLANPLCNCNCTLYKPLRS